MTHHIPAGTTEAQDFQLLADGNPLDGTGLLLELLVADFRRQPVPIGGSVNWSEAASGRVRYYPLVTDLPLERSPYFVRWSVTDPSGRRAFFPNGDLSDTWIVVAVP